MKQAIGIFGGTFDPIHYGHLKPAQQILQQLDLGEISLLPSHKPPHKVGTQASSTQRAEMVQLACRDMPGFSVDLRELAREDPSYTVITLQSLRAELPDTPLCFLMGMDSLLAFKRWHRWQEILELCHLLVSYRPGWTLDAGAEISDLLKQRQTSDSSRLHRQASGLIYLAPIDPLDISATQIRANIQAGVGNGDILPEAVEAYIAANGLYR